ncbi:DUF4082 domain-containing protein [Fibrella sp. HMF5036]|uniref:DUF4082 domain-containing protein n=2 Tax=Fibrella aquatilis TaxID=2817059 RepID=A0A939FZT6_9BACT|nr:DUF4082 domain-containing protein [Fibrella aquatilis]
MLASTSCKKTADANPEETPFTSLVKGDATLTSGVRTSGPWELGIVFNSSVAGKITKVGSKMPEPGSYRVIIWDNDTKAVLRQKTIEQSSPDVLTMEPIDALTVPVNKKYVISINSQSGGTNKKYGYVYKTGGGDFLPVNKGSILVLNSCYQSVATATFPSAAQNVKYEFYGFPEFAFVAD